MPCRVWARSAVLLAMALALRPLPAASASPGRGPVYFLANGGLFAADLDARRVQQVGWFSPAAPTVARDPLGRFWGRLDRRVFAAVEPDTGSVTAALTLPYSIYNHLITPQGKAYVTHHTLTEHGFTLSVVDTRAGRLLTEIEGLPGLRTGLAQSDSHVYLATVSVEGPRVLTLLRIDPRTDRPEEMRSLRDEEHVWSLAVSGQTLYVLWQPLPGSSGESRIELIDLETGSTYRSATAAALAGGGFFYGEPALLAGRLYLPWQSRAGGRPDHALVETGPEARGGARLLPIRGRVYRLLAREGGLLLYLELPEQASGRGLTLCFYDTGEGKEVKRIDILSALRD